MSEYDDSVIDNDDEDAETPGAIDKDDEKILAMARKRYQSCQTADTTNKTAALDDLNFLVGGENQWPAQSVINRKLDGRPIITVNSLPTYLHQVTNDQRMNTPAIKVHPTGGKSSQETAKIRQGIIRHIEYDSNADVAYDTAVNSAAAIGFGYFRLVTEYESPTSFDQKIMFQRIRNALSVKIDPLCIEPDGSDMKYCFVELKMSKQEFKRLYPKANASSTVEFDDGAEYAEWLTDTEVLVCDYYCIEETPADVVLLSNGESGYKDELPEELPEGITIKDERKGSRRKTMLYKIGGGMDVLARTEIKSKWIPVFPVYGDEIDIQGRIIRSGIIRHAKGPAQMYNVTMTSATEEVSLRSKTPYIGAVGQFDNLGDMWKQANNRAFPYLEYNPITVDGTLAPPPRRNEMADIPHGFLALASHAADNIKKTTGLFDASLGARGTATSGVQEQAQQREGDMANYHYADGLLRTIRHAGRVLNCMISGYYDGERVVKIMNPDNKADAVRINYDYNGSVANDMSCDDFDITVTAGASYSTLRQESAEFFTRAMQSAKDPATAAVVTYLAMKNQDVPGGDEATAMLKALLPANVVDATAGDNADTPMVQTSKGPVPVAQVPQLLEKMQEQIQQMGEALKKADITKQQTEQMKQQQLLNEQKLEPMRLQAEQQRTAAEFKKAEAAAMQAEAALLKARADAQIAPEVSQAQLLKAQTEAQNAETSKMTAEINLLQEAERLKLDEMKLNVEARKADAELMTTGADVMAAKLEVAKLIQEMRPKAVSAMKIKAPSGQVYDVDLGDRS